MWSIVQTNMAGPTAESREDPQVGVGVSPWGAQGRGDLWGQWRRLPCRAGATNPGSAAPCSVQGNHCVVFTLKRHAALPGHLPHRRFQKQNVLFRLLLLSHFPRQQEKAGASGVVFRVMCSLHW